jgi:hypothetical protein
MLAKKKPATKRTDSKKKAAKKSVAQPASKAGAARRRPALPPRDMAAMFEEGKHMLSRQSRFRVQIRKAGKIDLRPGEVWAGDPCTPSGKMIGSGIPAGQYEVELSLAEIDRQEKRVAGARVRLGRKPATSWRAAGSYGVDAGMGAFCDAQLVPALQGNRAVEGATAKLIRGSSSVTVSGLGPAKQNLICFLSGWGDGRYETFCGYDETEKLVEVITDFAVLPRRDELVTGIGANLQSGRVEILIRGETARGAATAGLKRGDAIITIDGETVEKLGWEGALQQLRGPIGGKVRLGIKRKGEQLEVVATRE